MKKYKKSISVVVPVYNESESISTTITRLLEVVSSWDYGYEIIFVNDGSLDNTATQILNVCKKNNKVKLINFSRNFGHQFAMTAGMDYSKGDALILIDGDLQDPPEVMNKFISEWEKGMMVVYGKRIRRKGENLFKKLSAKLFYWLMNILSKTEIPKDVGDFRLMDRVIVNEVKNMRERHRFIRGMISWVGYEQSYVQYVRDKRYRGKTKFSFNKMLNFALDGIFSFSTRPLQYTVIAGIGTTLLSILGIFYALFARLTTDGWVSGWTTLIISILFIGGIQIISIGILGQYIGRIFEEIKKRPMYIIKSSINIE